MLVLILTGIFLSLSDSTVSATKENIISVCPEREVDLVFVLALPRTVSDDDFEALKKGLVEMINALPLDKVNVATVIFAGEASISFDFNDYSGRHELIDAINNISRLLSSHDLNTDLAINLVTRLFTDSSLGSRESASEVSLIITNGRSKNFNRLQRAMRRVPKSLEQHLLNVGGLIPNTELDLLTLGDQSRQYRIDNCCDVQTLHYLPKYLYCSCTPSCVRGTCDTNGTCTCPEGWVGEDCDTPTCRPRDFIVVLDSSDSLSNLDFELAKNFVADLLNDSLFLIEKGRYHTGMVAYGDGIEVVYNLRQIYEKDRVVQTVRDLERLDAFRGTRTTKALTKAYNMFQSRGRPLTTAPHTMLVITDGKATDDKGGSLDRILVQIRAAEIEVFCITINIDEDNREEIERIPDDRAHILRLPDFEGLAEFAGLAAENFCQKPDKPVCVPACVHGTCGPEGTCVCDAGWTGLDCGWPVCNPCCLGFQICSMNMTCVCPPGWTREDCDEPVCRKRDILLLLDNSYSLSNEDFHFVKKFVSDFINTLSTSVGSEHVRFAIKKYAYDVATEYILSFPQEATLLVHNATRMSRLNGLSGTRTALALRSALELFLEQGRPYVDWTIVLVGTGRTTDDNSALEKIIDDLNTAGVFRFFIGIGPDIVQEDLVAITGSKARTFIVRSADDMVTKAKQAADFICMFP